jgi:hypothetical protein
MSGWKSADLEAARRMLAGMRDLSWPLERTELDAALERLGRHEVPRQKAAPVGPQVIRLGKSVVPAR